MTSQPRYRITLTPTPGEVPPVIRLRKLLKFALRACGLRCTEVAELTTDESSTTKPHGIHDEANDTKDDPNPTKD